jgi:hypothetical protein
MRTWLKVDRGYSRDVEKPKHGSSEILEKPVMNMSFHADDGGVTEEMLTDSAVSSPGQQQRGCSGKPTTEFKTDLPRNTAQEPKPISMLRPNRGSVSDLVSSLLDFWGISFFFYNLVEFFAPPIQPGYKRLRWRCVSRSVPHYSFKLSEIADCPKSCNTTLRGDFPVDDNHALDLLEREFWRNMPLTQQGPSSDTSTFRPNPDSDTGSPGAHLRHTHSIESFSKLGGVQHTGSSSQNLINISNPSPFGGAHIANTAFSPRYFEVCIDIGNSAIDHHEIDISRVTSDSELFELIWDMYNSSRSRLRRLFFETRDVHFVMVSAPLLPPYLSISC